LNGLKQKKSQLARYAPIGQMAFVDAEIVSIGPQIQSFKQKLSTTQKEEDRKPLQERIETLQRRLKKLKEDAPNMPPDSFPFIAFSSEFVNGSYTVPDTELLARARRLQLTLNKYDPYSADSFGPMVKDDAGLKVPVDYIRYKENLNDSPVSVKDPAIVYLKSRPPRTGAKMSIKSDVRSFQDANYNVDYLIKWTNGKIDDGNKDGEFMLKLHHAIKRHAGDYLLELMEEFEMEKRRIRGEIDFEIRNYLMDGKEGRYVNRWSASMVIEQMTENQKQDLFAEYRIPDDKYIVFNKVMEIDNKGYNKWKKYANRKRKRYMRYMNTMATQVVTTTPGDNTMKPYYELNAEAEKKREMIGKIEEEKEAREAIEVKEEVAEEPSAEEEEVKEEPAEEEEVKEESNEPDEQELIKEVMIGNSKYYDDEKPPLGGPYDLLDNLLRDRGEDINPYLSGKGLTAISSLSGRIDSVFNCVEDKDDIKSFKTCINLEFLKLEELRGTKYEKIVEDTYKRRNKLIRKKKLTRDWAMSVNKDFIEKNSDPLRPACSKSKTKQFKRRMELLGFDIDWPQTMMYNKTVETDLREQLTDFTEEDFLELFTKKGKKGYLCKAPDQNYILYLLSPFPTVESRFEKYAKKRINTNQYHKKAFEWSRKDFNKISVFEPCVKINDKIGRVIELLDGEMVKFRAFDGSESNHNLSEIRYPSKEDCTRAAADAKTEEDKKDLDEGARLAEENAPQVLEPEKTVAVGKLQSRTYPDGKTLYSRVSDGNAVVDGLKDESGPIARYYKKENGQESIEIDGTIYKFPKDAEMYITEDYGESLSKKKEVGMDKLLSGAKSILDKLKEKKICHGRITLDNLVWNGKNLTLINFFDAKDLGSNCPYQIEKNICITPPLEGELIDQWGMVLALLQYKESKFSEKIVPYLFGLKGEDCLERVDMTDFKNGIFFLEDSGNPERAVKRIKRFGNDDVVDIFKYMFYIFAKSPGKGVNQYGYDPTVTKPGTSENILKLLFSDTLLEDGPKNLALKWVSGNKKLGETTEALKTPHLNATSKWVKKMHEISVASDRIAKRLLSEYNGPYYPKEKNSGKDLGEIFYGMPASQVSEIFGLIDTSGESATSQSTTVNRSSFLDYDSFSDIELDELAAELEPLDELDVDQLLDGYDSVSDISIAGNTYDSESEQSIGYASSYNSESEQSLGYASAYNSESEQSLAYGADYNSESEFSDGFGAYNSESEHSTSYDSESDLDR